MPRSIVSGCLSIVLTSCTTPVGRLTPPRDHVVAIIVPYLTAMPFYMADEEGYFAEQGLEVDFRRVGRSQDVMASLAHGDADVSAGMLTVNELGFVAAGARLRLIASLGELAPDACTFLGIVVRREHVESGALTDESRIRRMRFDMNRLQPLGYFVDELLRPYDLTTHDLDSVDVTPPAALEMLQHGDIDVTVDAEPYVSRHLATGGAVLWRGVEELLPGYIVAMAMFGPSLLDERPDVGERLTVALLKGIRQFRLGKTPRNLDIVERSTGLAPALVADACWPVMSEDARIDSSVFLGYQQWLITEGLLDRVLEEDELVDSRFIDHANAELMR